MPNCFVIDMTEQRSDEVNNLIRAPTEHHRRWLAEATLRGPEHRARAGGGKIFGNATNVDTRRADTFFGDQYYGWNPAITTDLNGFGCPSTNPNSSDGKACAEVDRKGPGS
jgi:hypothetical protein